MLGLLESRAWLNQLEAAHRDRRDVGANMYWKATHTMHGMLEQVNVINVSHKHCEMLSSS